MIVASAASINNGATLPLTVQHKHGFRFYLRRGLLALVILIVALPLSGFVYETVMAAGDAQRFPPPGQMVSVDGRQMHIDCVGAGSPTVIFEVGLGDWSDGWSRVQPTVGTFARACSYDHAGLGWSAPSDQPRTQAQIAAELHDLLVAAHIQPPYILVGPSLGGKTVRLFAAQHPEEVAGLVFVDARHESVEPSDSSPEKIAQDSAAFDSSLNIYRVLRETGARLFAVPLARMFDASLRTLPDDLVYRVAIFTARESTLQTESAEFRESRANDDQLRAAQLSVGLPVVVLTADASLASWDIWKTGQQNLVALSSNSQWVVVKNSSHKIQNDQPQAVIDAVHRVANAVNTGEPLPQ